MSKIKLVIEIDEETIEYSKRCTDINYRFTDTLLDQHRYERNMAQAIANGTPITEGDMISRQELLDSIQKVIEDMLPAVDRLDIGYNNGLYKACELIETALSIGGNQNE